MPSARMINIDPEATVEVEDSGVAWAAIFGGALAAVAVSVVLSPLGSALGMAMATPWHHVEPGKAITIMGAIWLIIVQWVSSGFGGYLTGRLRTKWPGAHTHEVFFRDTVHGFLAWALATVVGAAVLMSVFAHMAAANGHEAESAAPAGYYSDTLFRTTSTSSNVTDADRTEASRILATGAMGDGLANGDRRFLVQLVAARADVSQAEAGARIDEALTRQKAALEHMRKTASAASFFIALSLFIGAFIAAAAGALGGMHRDVHYETGRLSAL